MPEYGIPLIFFLIAFFYASVGFGGGSSYLALLSLFLTEFQEIRTLALLLNIIVVGIGTFMFIRNDVFKWKAFLALYTQQYAPLFFRCSASIVCKNVFSSTRICTFRSIFFYIHSIASAIPFQ